MCLRRRVLNPYVKLGAEQKVAVVILYTLIREVLGSNLNRDTGCPDWSFSSAAPKKCRDGICI
jgi:hypothetical protein